MEDGPSPARTSEPAQEAEPVLEPGAARRIERLFDEAKKNTTKAFASRNALDRLGVLGEDARTGSWTCSGGRGKGNGRGPSVEGRPFRLEKLSNTPAPETRAPRSAARAASRTTQLIAPPGRCASPRPGGVRGGAAGQVQQRVVRAEGLRVVHVEHRHRGGVAPKKRGKVLVVTSMPRAVLMKIASSAEVREKVGVDDAAVLGACVDVDRQHVARTKQFVAQGRGVRPTENRGEPRAGRGTNTPQRRRRSGPPVAPMRPNPRMPEPVSSLT